MNEMLAQLTLAISAVDRFRAVGRSFERAGAAPWIVLGVGAVILGGVIAFFALAHRRDGVKERWQKFLNHAARASLGDEERALLRNIAINAQLKNPEAVFTSEETFLRGMAAVNGGRENGGLFGEAKMTPCASCKHYQSLRAKLGFSTDASHPGESPSISLGPIHTGSTLKVIRQRAPHDVEVLLETVDEKTGELTVGKRQGLAVRIGEQWTLRYTEDGLLWEFSGQVVAVKSETELLVKPTGEAKEANRRRFARVSVNRPAQIAVFPFSTRGAEAEAPQFIPARMVELAGPGLLMETDLDARLNDRVLVVLELAETRVEGLGVVRRETQRHGGTTLPMAVELVGLNTAQIAQLARETNAFATGSAWRKEALEHGVPREQPDG